MRLHVATNQIDVHLEEHRGTGKFSGKYAPQSQQTEPIWTMPWGCLVELEDKGVHCKEWEYIIENFTEEEADSIVHQIYGQRATLSVTDKPGDLCRSGSRGGRRGLVLLDASRCVG